MKIRKELASLLLCTTTAFVNAQHPDARIQASGVFVPFESKTLNSRNDYQPVSDNLQLSKYGGWLNGPRLAATNRFRVEKINGRWWAVDPEGYTPRLLVFGKCNSIISP